MPACGRRCDVFLCHAGPQKLIFANYLYRQLEQIGGFGVSLMSTVWCRGNRPLPKTAFCRHLMRPDWVSILSDQQVTVQSQPLLSTGRALSSLCAGMNARLRHSKWQQQG